MDKNKKEIKPKTKTLESNKNENKLFDEKKDKEKIKENNEQKEMTCTLISGDLNYII
jgi:hypothetical protein